MSEPAFYLFFCLQLTLKWLCYWGNFDWLHNAKLDSRDTQRANLCQCTVRSIKSNYPGSYVILQVCT